MLTGGMGYSYNNRTSLPLTQTNLAAYPVTKTTLATSASPAGMPNAWGGLIVIAPNKQVVATGFTGRRAIVEDARCNSCHQELGTFTEDAFHAGQRNDGTTCSWCHTPNRTNTGWSVDSTTFVHAIHGGAQAQRAVHLARGHRRQLREHRVSGRSGPLRAVPLAGVVRLQEQRVGGRGGPRAATRLDKRSSAKWRAGTPRVDIATRRSGLSPWVVADFTAARLSARSGAATTNLVHVADRRGLLGVP